MNWNKGNDHTLVVVLLLVKPTSFFALVRMPESTGFWWSAFFTIRFRVCAMQIWCRSVSSITHTTILGAPSVAIEGHLISDSPFLLQGGFNTSCILSSVWLGVCLHSQQHWAEPGFLTHKMACYSQAGIHVDGYPHVRSKANGSHLFNLSLNLLLCWLVLGLHHGLQSLKEKIYNAEFVWTVRHIIKYSFVSCMHPYIPAL